MELFMSSTQRTTTTQKEAQQYNVMPFAVTLRLRSPQPSGQNHKDVCADDDAGEKKHAEMLCLRFLILIHIDTY